MLCVKWKEPLYESFSVFNGFNQGETRSPRLLDTYVMYLVWDSTEKLWATHVCSKNVLLLC